MFFDVFFAAKTSKDIFFAAKTSKDIFFEELQNFHRISWNLCFSSKKSQNFHRISQNMRFFFFFFFLFFLFFFCFFCFFFFFWSVCLLFFSSILRFSNLFDKEVFKNEVC